MNAGKIIPQDRLIPQILNENDMENFIKYLREHVYCNKDGQTVGYYLIFANSWPALNDYVNAALREGWSLYGDVKIFFKDFNSTLQTYHIIYHQAIQY